MKDRDPENPIEDWGKKSRGDINWRFSFHFLGLKDKGKKMNSPNQDIDGLKLLMKRSGPAI